MIDMNESVYKAICSALDELTVAIFLLSLRGRVLYVNETGKAMIQQDCLLRCVNDHLQGLNRKVSDDLERGIKSMLGDGKPGTSNPAHYELCLRSAPEGKPGAVGYLRRLPSVEGEEPVVALFITSTDDGGLYGVSALAESYGLTAAETRVLEKLIETQSPAKVAERLGLSLYTVKSHLRKIFQKTGTARQVELLRLIECFRVPLRAATPKKSD